MPTDPWGWSECGLRARKHVDSARKYLRLLGARPGQVLVSHAMEYRVKRAVLAPPSESVLPAWSREVGEHRRAAWRVAPISVQPLPSIGDLEVDGGDEAGRVGVAEAAADKEHNAKRLKSKAWPLKDKA